MHKLIWLVLSICLGSSSGRGGLVLPPELSVVLTEYPRDEKTQSNIQSLFANLDGMKTRIKETEVGIAASLEILIHRAQCFNTWMTRERVGLQKSVARVLNAKKKAKMSRACRKKT